MQRKYTKIKYNPNKVECYFSFRTDNGNEYTVKSKDLPLPSFIETLALLDQWVLEMCELPQEYLGRIATRSVSLNYSDDDVMSATLTISQQLSAEFKHAEQAGITIQPRCGLGCGHMFADRVR